MNGLALNVSVHPFEPPVMALENTIKQSPNAIRQGTGNATLTPSLGSVS